MIRITRLLYPLLLLAALQGQARADEAPARRARSLMIGGTVISVLGGLAFSAGSGVMGAEMLSNAREPGCGCAGLTAFVGMPLLAIGLLHLAVGVPMTAVGAVRYRREHTRPTLALIPNGRDP